MLMEKVTYHINPETGRANICRATVKGCKFTINGQAPEHYKTKQAAQRAYERQNDEKTLIIASKTDGGSGQKQLGNTQESAKNVLKNSSTKRMRKSETETILKAARNYRREKDREGFVEIYKKQRVSLFEKIEDLTKQIEELENDKKQVRKYIEVLSTRSYTAGFILTGSKKSLADHKMRTNG